MYGVPELHYCTNSTLTCGIWGCHNAENVDVGVHAVSTCKYIPTFSPEDEGSVFFWNGIYLHVHTALKPGRPASTTQG
jgi:hypothetical protein